MKVLSESEIQNKLKSLKGWGAGRDGIYRQYHLADFRSSMNLVTRVADLAEEANHHPDILISYDKVTFTLITHDAGGITEKDFDLASRIEAVTE
jgi:4a-hydroxytetrahydrobiopterin dehydratase